MVSSKKFLRNRNQFVEIPFPEERPGFVSQFENRINMFIHNMKQCVDYPHLVSNEDIHDVGTGNTSPERFTQYVLDHINTETDIMIPNNSMKDYTHDTPFVKMFDVHFNINISREIVASENCGTFGSIEMFSDNCKPGQTTEKLIFENCNTTGFEYTQTMMDKDSQTSSDAFYSESRSLPANDESKSGYLNMDVHNPPREFVHRTRSQQSFCHSQMTYINDSDHGTANDSSQTLEQNQSTFSNIMSKSNVTQVSITMYSKSGDIVEKEIPSTFDLKEIL